MTVPPLPPDTLLAADQSGRPRYQLVECIASTGFGNTYRARANQLSADIALKEFAPPGLATRSPGSPEIVVQPAAKPEFVRAMSAFIREGKTLSRLHHPNIVRAIDCWRENGTAYLATEWIQQPRMLTNSACTALPADERRQILRTLLEALTYIHGEGLLHLDIKSANVLLDHTNRPRILDFGIARADDQLTNETIHAFFTPGWAPPEQMDATTIGRVGPWSDIYSWGMLAIEVLIGFPLGQPPMATTRSIGTDPLGDVSKRLLLQGVPRPWAMALQKCISLNPEHRFGSVAELTARLDARVSPDSLVPTKRVRLCDGCGWANPEHASYCTECGLTLTSEVRSLNVSKTPSTRRRAIAWAIDSVLLVALFIGLARAIVPMFITPGERYEEPTDTESLWIGIGVLVTFQALMVVYDTLGGKLLGGSPGKLIVKLRVLSATWEKPSMRRIFVRALSRAAFLFPPFFLMYGFIWLNPRRRALHDSLAGTCVAELSEFSMREA